jgi:hypothetical protein
MDLASVKFHTSMWTHGPAKAFLGRWRRRQRGPVQGLLISGHLGGDLPGVPNLERVKDHRAMVHGEGVYRLVFQEFTQHRSGGFCHLDRVASKDWRAIRILLPNGHEYVIRTKREAAP